MHFKMNFIVSKRIYLLIFRLLRISSRSFGMYPILPNGGSENIAMRESPPPKYSDVVGVENCHVRNSQEAQAGDCRSKSGNQCKKIVCRVFTIILMIAILALAVLVTFVMTLEFKRRQDAKNVPKCQHDASLDGKIIIFNEFMHEVASYHSNSETNGNKDYYFKIIHPFNPSDYPDQCAFQSRQCLELVEGEIVTVTTATPKIDFNGWLYGTSLGRRGTFPSNFVDGPMITSTDIITVVKGKYGVHAMRKE